MAREIVSAESTIGSYWQITTAVVFLFVVAIELPADELQATHEANAEVLDRLVQGYHAQLGESPDRRSELEPKVKAAIRKHLKSGDEVHLQRVATARKQLDVIESRLEKAKQKIDERTDREWLRLSAASVSLPEVNKSPPSDTAAASSSKPEPEGQPDPTAPAGIATTVAQAIPTADKLRQDIRDAVSRLEASDRLLQSVTHDKQRREQLIEQLERNKDSLAWVEMKYRTVFDLLKSDLEIEMVRATHYGERLQQIRELSRQAVATKAEVAQVESEKAVADQKLRKARLLVDLYRQIGEPLAALDSHEVVAPVPTDGKK